MAVQSLALKNFRNFPSLDLKFNQGFVVFVGPNGAGKTNLLESLYVCGALRRFPETKFGQLFLEGTNFFRVQAKTAGADPIVQEVFAEKSSTKYLYKFSRNGQKIPRSRYVGALPVVSFLPQDLNLLTHSPENRRRYLNETLAQASAPYRFALPQYRRALIHRNELWEKFRAGQAGAADFGIWDEQLAEYGAVINRTRQDFFTFLNTHSKATTAALSADLPDLTFMYQMSGGISKQEFLHGLKQIRDLEEQRGLTLIGPHRDDFRVYAKAREVVGFVSRGQLRSITLALKFLEQQYLEAALRLSPIILLDDVFSEFDRDRQERVVGHLQTFPQVFISTAHWEEIRSRLPANAQILEIADGSVSAVYA